MTQRRKNRSRAEEAPYVRLRELSDPVAELSIVPVDPENLGRKGRSADGEFLLEESLRFFNYGARPKKSTSPGVAFVEKGYTQITSDLFEKELAKFCHTHTEYLYNHVNKVYKHISIKSLPHFSAKLGRSNRWMKAAASDTRLKAIFVPHAMFGNLDGPIVPAHILQFHKIIEVCRKSSEMLEMFHRGLPAIKRMLAPEYSAEIVTNHFAALDSKDWLGSPYAIDPSWNLGEIFITKFIGNSGGMAERIYATLVQCVSMINYDPRRNLDNDAVVFEPTIISQSLEDKLRFELSKLGGFLGTKKWAPSIFETWLDGIFYIETLLGNVFSQASLFPTAQGSEDAKYVIRSDILWGYVLCSYLRLHIVRAIGLALTASIPFRQIYEGGYIWPGESKRKVPGIVGIIAVSLWEYFTNTQTPHPLSKSARTFAPSISGWDTKIKWVDPDTPLTAPSALKKLVNPIFSKKRASGHSLFPITVSILFNSGYASPGTERIYSIVSLPLTKDTHSPLQFYSGGNMQSWVWANDKRKSWKTWCEEVKAGLIAFTDFPPSGTFPIKYEKNHVIIDDFFVLGTEVDYVFNKWEKADSGLSFAIKLSCQLQMYVAGWLYVRLLRAAKLKMPEFSGLSQEIKFTAGSIQYGGKFPPHITHRDGYGADWSLYGEPEQMWHWSVQWARDDAKVKIDVSIPGNTVKRINAQSDSGLAKIVTFPDDTRKTAAKQDLANLLMGEGTPLRHKCQLVRQYYINKLTKPSIKKAEIKAVRKEIHQELMNILPIEYLKGHMGDDGYYLPSAIPSDPLIAQHRDRHNNREGLAKPVYVFRDRLKTCVRMDQDACEKRLRELWRTPGAYSVVDDLLRSYAEQYRDWPIFPDRTSHWAHHVAHLAVLLSMPLEFCWGTPIYHFRAIRAICLAFLDAPLHPFLGNFLEDESDKELRKTIGGGWPLPLPRLQFLPHDHHHHWHLNYWRTEPLPNALRARLRSDGMTHKNFVSSCLPMWTMLGVDFKPFEKYLDQYEKIVTGSLRTEIMDLRLLIGQKQRLVTESLPSDSLKGLDTIITRLAELVIEDFEDPDELTEWPIPGSHLEHAIDDARNIKEKIDEISDKIKIEEMPIEIREALEKELDEQNFDLQQYDANVPKMVGEVPDEYELQSGASEGHTEILDEQYNPEDANETLSE